MTTPNPRRPKVAAFDTARYSNVPGNNGSKSAFPQEWFCTGTELDWDWNMSAVVCSSGILSAESKITQLVNRARGATPEPPNKFAAAECNPAVAVP